MRGFVFDTNGQLGLRDVPRPDLQAPSDAVVRVTLSTICGSDVGLVRGQIPTEPGFVLGHEFVGVVEEVGPAVQQVRPGDRVVGPAAPFDGVCPNCRAGQIQRCLHGGVVGSGRPWGNLGGALSDYLRMPFADMTLVHVPDQLDDEQVLFVGDILSTGYFGVTRAGLRPGEAIVVLGAGPVGLCTVHTAALFGPRMIVAVDLVRSRLEVAHQMGATHLIDATGGDVVARVLALTGGRGPEVVVDAAGASTTIQQAVEVAAIGGRITLVGIPGQSIDMPVPMMLMKNLSFNTGLAYLGEMERLIREIEAGRLDLRPLITHRRRLAEIEDSFRLFERQEEGVVKIAITP